MTDSEYVASALVAFTCVCAWVWKWLNPTLVALAASFLIVHGIWLGTGFGSLWLSIACDYLVVLVIFLKVDMGCAPFGGLWANYGHCWAGIPRSDRIVLALFLPAWAAVFYPMSGDARYKIVWGCGVAQVLSVAGAEASASWRRRQRKEADASPPGPFMREGLALPFPLSRALVP